MIKGCTPELDASARTAPRTYGGRCISIAFLTGLVFAPVVIATGLLTEPSARDRVPPDITVAVLRPSLDSVVTDPAPDAAVPSNHP